MNDRVRFEDALVKAHESGDTEGARVIAAEIKSRFVKPARSMPPAKSDPMLAGYSPLLETLKPFVTPGGMEGRFKDVSRSFTQGAGDLAVGAGQLVAEGAGVLGATGFRDRYRDAMQSREALYQGGRATDTPDVARGAGGIVASGPFIPGTAAPSLLGRMAQGAKAGGALSLASPVQATDDFWLAKGVQGAASTAIGGIAPPLVEGLVGGVGSAVNAIRNAYTGLTNRVTPQAIEGTLRTEFQNAGVNWGALTQQQRQALVSETQSALQSGGSLNPDAVRRIADFQRAGIQPTAGQIAREGAQFARERNLAQMQVGAPLQQRFQQQNDQLVAGVGPIRDQYALGNRVISSLEARDAPRRAGVDAAYAGARDHLGRAAPMDSVAFANEANRALDENMLGAYLPTEVRTILNRVSGGEIPFNVNTAVQIDRVLSAAQRSAGNGTPQSLAIGQVRNSLNRAPIADNVGEDAKRTFDAARGMAAQRFGNIERTPALGAALDEGVAPEKFVEKFAIRGEVNDVANFMRNLTNEGRQATRQGVIDWIRRQAVNGVEDTATFSQAGMNSALEAIGNRKLELIFAGDRGTLQTLRTLGRVGAYVQKQPVSSGVNYSASGTMLADAADRAGGLPVLGALLGKPGDLIRSAQVTGSLRPVPVTPQAPLLSDELLRRIGRPAGLLGGLVSPGIGTGILGLQ